MSYTSDRHPEGKVHNYANLIRQAMVAEVVAINDYSRIISRSSIKDLNKLLYHIMEEEKEHYGMFLNALRNIDPKAHEAMVEAQGEGINLKTLKQLETYSAEKFVSPRETLSDVREGIKGELEAIILYEDQISKMKMPELKQIFLDIIYDEKHHVEELTLALLQLDPDSYGPISKD